MVTEWLVKYHSGERWLTRVRLGSPRAETPGENMTLEERAMIGAWRRWADALILTESKVSLIEAAIRPDPGKISQLELYAMLFPHTPELIAFRNVPLHMILLYAIEDPATVILARNKGIEAIEYKPLWLDSYLEILAPRERRGVRL
jgi:hypothetical protein